MLWRLVVLSRFSFSTGETEEQERPAWFCPGVGEWQSTCTVSLTLLIQSVLVSEVPGG